MWPFRRKEEGQPNKEKEGQVMPEEGQQNQAQQGQEGAQGAQQDPKPQTVEVPVDFFANMTETFQKISSRLDYLEGQGQQPQPLPTPPKPEIPDVSDADYYEAIAEANRSGDYTKVREMDTVRRKATEERAVRRMQEEFTPQLQQGAQIIDQLSSRVVRSEMPYYDDLKDEIESELLKAPVEQRMNPELRLAAYRYVVGKNTDKIIDLEMQRRLRQQENQVIPGTPGTGGGDRQTGAAAGGGAGAEVKPYTEVLSKDSIDALRAVGKTGDDYARSLGYADWGEYYTKMHKPYYEGAEEGGAT